LTDLQADKPGKSGNSSYHKGATAAVKKSNSSFQREKQQLS
jgi:hypothetical protein